MPRSARATPWWVAFASAAFFFVLADAALAWWSPKPLRLPESFSPAYFQRYADSLRGERNVVVVLGDSVLWGYKIRAEDAMPALLQRRLPHDHVLNLSYEGGSTTNSEILVRYLLARGIRPRLVIFNVNSKEMNPADSAFRRLEPAVEEAARPLLDRSDSKLLTLLPNPNVNQRLGALVERYWRLYRYRVDLREKVFRTDDLATLLTAASGRLTGYAQRAEAAHRPTAERFLGTYDMTPLDATNTAFARMNRMSEELRASGIPALAFLTPTNHALLHAYIDVPDYYDNLKTIRDALAARGVPVANLDNAVPQREFIDNDHLTPRGNRRLLDLLFPYIERALR